MKLVRSPLRISLVGGGSDVPAHFLQHGGAVVSATINKYIYISSKPCSSLYPHKYRLVYSQVEETNSIESIKHPIIREVLRQKQSRGLDLDIMSDVPAGTGLGSSSAFTVGMYKSLDISLDPEQLAYRAVTLETKILAEPIGYQDQYAAAYGGLNHIKFNSEDARVIKLPNSDKLHNYLTLVYVGGSRSAGKQLEKQIKPDNTKSLCELASMANLAASAIKLKRFDTLGEIIRRGWEIKKTLSPDVSTPFVDLIIEQAIKYGATAGKLLGAGGAGFVLLYCPPEKRIAMYEGLHRLNLTYLPFEFDNEGCKVLYED